jgi:hypothetical protein
VVVAAVLALAIGVSAAAAANCGGARPCKCGDRVVEDYRMTTDLGPCAGDGLRIAARVVFDGGGHEIVGTMPRKTVGLHLPQSASGSFVQNVTVRGFERGIRLNGVSGAQVVNVEAHRNGDFEARVGYGIDVAGGASSNRIERARVYENADEGIHFGRHARGNRLVKSRVHDNGRENVYVLDGVENVVEDCDISGAGAAAVYVKHAKATTLVRNRISDRPVVVRGAASGTRIVDATLRDSGIVLQRYVDEKLGTTAPVRTLVRGTAISGTAVCIRVEGAADTVLEDVRFGCARSLEIGDGSAVSLLGRPPEDVRCTGPGELREVRRVEVEFVSSEGTPLPGVQVFVAGAREPLGEANRDGRFAGDVVVFVRACPGLVARPASPLRVAAGRTERTVPADDLRGRMVIGAPDVAPSERDTPGREPSGRHAPGARRKGAHAHQPRGCDARRLSGRA